MKNKKTLFVCDNRDSANWGCRATSIALGQLLNENSILETTSRENASRKHPIFGLGRFSHLNPYASKLFSKSLNLRVIEGANRLFGGYSDYVDNNPAVSLKRFLKAAENDKLLAEIKRKFEESEKVVINGEGSLIFRTPPRRDLNFQMFAIELANSLGKDVYFVNAMASVCPKTHVNKEVQEFVVKSLEKCTAVSNRDPVSAELLSGLGLKGVTWGPDALFTWFDRYNELLRNNNLSKFPQLFDVWPESDKIFESWSNWPNEYICISGASRPPGINAREWIGFFSKLVTRLQKEVGLPIVFVDPSGDEFLHEVAIKSNSYFIRSSLQLLLGASILGKAKAYISGRFHPSILASLSGTPCVFLGSNSHKTASLQTVLSYPQKSVFEFSEESNNMNRLVAEIKANVANSDAYRGRIIETVAERSREAKEHLQKLIFS